MVMLFTNMGEDTLFGYKNLPKYRVLRKYREQGIADITKEAFQTDDWLEVLDLIVNLKHVCSQDVESLIDNFSQASQPMNTLVNNL